MYGGAAGGGKSSALLMAAAQYADRPGYSALILRKSFRDLNQADSLIPRSKEWWHGRAHWNEQAKRWTFPSGATITFGYLDHEGSKYQYQGAAYQFIAFDELTQFDEKSYRYLFSRLRGPAGSDVPERMRSGSNPGGVGHEWVKKRFIPDEYLADKSGTRTGRAWWKGRALFVPAVIADNAFLDAKKYAGSLGHLDPVTRSQLMEGDWQAHEGGHFQERWFKQYTQIPPDSWLLQPGMRPAVKDHCQVIVAVDPAGGVSDAADYTAMVVAARTPAGEILVLDVVRERLAVEAIVPRLQGLCLEHRPSFVCMENEFLQSQYIRMARATPGIPTVKPMNTEGRSKMVRATPAIIEAEQGRVFLPQWQAPWKEDFVGELCLEADTQIVTMRGPVSIQNVVPGDSVMTRLGWRKVTKSFCTGRASVCEIRTTGGGLLRATSNHPILVPGSGFIPAGALTEGDGLLRYTGGIDSTATRTPKKATSAGKSGARRSFYTAPFGSARSARSLPETTSTTGMGTLKTTPCPTCNAFPRQIISRTTGRCSRRARSSRERASCATPPTRAIRAAVPERVPSGAATRTHSQGASNTSTPGSAPCALQNSAAPISGPGSAQSSAPLRSSSSTAGSRPSPASIAGACSCHPPARGFFAADVVVSSTRMLPGERPVYNLEVEGCHEFVANGLLVHNCSFTGDDKLDAHDDQVDAFAWAVIAFNEYRPAAQDETISIPGRARR